MKIKNNNYYRNLYIRLLKAYDLKQNNHKPDEWYYTHINYSDYNYKNLISRMFNHEFNITNFGFQFNSEEELLINLDLRGI